MSAKRPRACGRMTVRSSSGLQSQTSDDGVQMLRWFDQKSTMTSNSCRFDQTDRTMWARTTSFIASQAPFLTSVRTCAGVLSSSG